MNISSANNYNQTSPVRPSYGNMPTDNIPGVNATQQDTELLQRTSNTNATVQTSREDQVTISSQAREAASSENTTGNESEFLQVPGQTEGAASAQSMQAQARQENVRFMMEEDRQQQTQMDRQQESRAFQNYASANSSPYGAAAQGAYGLPRIDTIA
ncbi:MAG: hypothetical protein HQK66_01285 [Desulfamplus sp.]|nr:hypothetical protein [Desulfamplus sp.]